MKTRAIIMIIGTMLLMGCLLPQSGFTQQKDRAFEILERLDKNMVFETIYSESEMIITANKRKISKSLTGWSQGNEKSFMTFLSPARDKGTKILKLDNIIKVYYPSAERVMRLSGHMMRQSMMGSDFSYEDMTQRATKMREEYTGEVMENILLDGRPCYLLKLTSKKKKQTYYTRKMWIEKERFIGLKEELYARSGKLLKVITINEIKTFKDRHYPIRMTIEDKLRRNSKTEMIFKKIDFDAKIPAGIFTDRNLMKK